MTTFEGTIEWPKLERYSDRPAFNTKAVVQQTGIPAPTLRAWERRYALFSPKRADNSYRLYTERDIVLIRWLRGRLGDGMSISQAIALYRHLNQNNEIGLAQKETDQPDYMLVARDNLITLFQDFDEQAAHVLIGSLFSLYPMEQVCVELIIPTLWQIGNLWADGKLTVCVEHFASNFFRAILTNRFHLTPGSLQGPLVLVGSASGETHELATLMLALFLRLRGLRVSYLGQNVETAGLLDTVHKLRPTLLCVSLTMPSYISALTNLAHQIQNLPAPRPLFAFGGQAFSACPDMVAQIPGQYYQGDLRTIADKLTLSIQSLMTP
jgi:DNA-binding transcriptional MerR regulator